MLGGKLALALAAAALAPEAAADPQPAPPAPAEAAPGGTSVDFEAAIGICRLALAEQLAGRRPTAALARIEELGEEQRRTVVIICAAYETGQQDLLEIMRASPPQPPAAPAPSADARTI